jgi:hypothetical protein
LPTPAARGARLGATLTLALLAAACEPVPDPGLYPAFDPRQVHPLPDKALAPPDPAGQLFWGDLHIHTSYSTDAWTNGVRATPDDAYTFARGGEIEHAAGYGIRLQRPLDFAAVTDHAEYLGVLRATDPDLPLKARTLRQHLLEDGRLANSLMIARSLAGFDLRDAAVPDWQAISRSAWRDSIEIAQRHNEPGRFTTLIGYEWTSMPGDRNLHRNVIYRGTAVPALPFSAVDSEDPRDLWTALEAQRAEGMDNFAIPHNGNVSDGLMYDRVQYDGTAMNASYAERRLRNEPISEIFQVKGSSETHPLLSDEDSFAGFELYDTLLSTEQRQGQAAGSYARDALRRGIEFSHAEGFNPYRFGVIGSSDGHNASSPVEEDNYHGKLPLLDGSAGLRLGKATYFPADMPGGVRWSAAGLAGVWAPENTREALFDAMRRRETFATSGPRIAVRFYGGWDFDADLIDHHERLARAQQQGVPMGAELPAPTSTAPRFLVWAQRDPEGANLDRLQIVKGWVTADGESRERVFDVAWSGDRVQDPTTGALPAVGSSVDLATASYTNTLGEPVLQTLWTDPAFDSQRPAFYYARVIEIPTPRWSTFDAQTLQTASPSPGTLQERAVTSAIWYQP